MNKLVATLYPSTDQYCDGAMLSCSVTSDSLQPHGL